MPLKLVRRHGSPCFYIRGSVRGQAVDESTRTDNEEAAEALRARREWQLLQRSVFGAEAAASFLEASVAYLEAGGEARFMARLQDHFGTAPLARIDQAAIDAAARALYPAAAPSTLNRQVYTPVSAVLRFAAARGLTPMRLVARPRQPPGRVRFLTPAEGEALIAACAPHLKPLVVFLLGTGARLGEALALSWRDVDLARAHAVFHITKNGEARGVPLHPRVVAAIASLGHREDLVFRRPDGGAYAARAGGGHIRTAFAGACRRAGISGFTPHDCRHTWATWHYAANRDLPALMALGGWKSEKMVLRYAHANVAHLAASIAALPWGKGGDHDSPGAKIAGGSAA